MKKSTKISLIITSLVLIIGVVAVVLVGRNVKPRKAIYCMDDLVGSLEEAQISVEILQSTVTANEMLTDDTYIITYRPKNGVKVFPENISPDGVKVDTHGTFLLYYSDENSFHKDYGYLVSKDETAFVGEIRKDDIIVENDFAGGDVITAYGATSYAPSLMNSEEFANQVKNSDREITVVVMDTGLYSNNSPVIPYFNLEDSYDFCNNDENVLDKTDSHATYVSSTILEVLGEEVTSKINLINAKIMQHGMGSFYDAYNAIIYYADMGVDIINCSFGARANVDIMEYAIEYAASKGVILICSSGNEYSTVGYPAAYKDAIAVGAIDSNKQVANFSNKGKEVMFCGPGVKMLEYGPENTMSFVDGTSFSAPALTAFSVMVMLDDESIDTREELVDRIREYCVDLGEPGKDDEYGYGLPVYHKPPTEPPTKEPETVNDEIPTTEPETTTAVKPVPEPETTTAVKPAPEPETTTVVKPVPEPETTTAVKPVPEPETTTAVKPAPEPETTSPVKPTPQKITVTFDANGGKASATSKAYEQGAKYGTLPTAARDYYKFDGWYTAATGGTKITSTTQLIKNSSHTLYAHWSQKTESEWVKYSDVPAGAKITGTKYKYTLTSYTTSNKSSLAGWTLYDKKTAWGNYGAWSNWSTNKATATDSRKVETKQEPYTYNTGRKLFNYSHYKYWNTTYNDWYYTYSYEAAAMNGINIVYEEIGWSTTELFLYTKFGNSEQSWGTRVNGTPWFNEMVKDETATGYTTYYRYADRSKVTTYYYKKTENKETTSDPSGQKNVSNVVKYVKYIEK